VRRDLWAGMARLGLALTVGVTLLLGGGPVRAQAPNRAALVVQYGEDAVSTHCVPFAEPQITGLDLLLRSGLDVVYASVGMGALVCKIGDVGCPDPGRCLCACKGADCVYWSYWHQVEGAWQYAVQGASQYVVRPGAVEGWVWGAGSASSVPQPPAVRFEDVCRDEAATPSLTGTLPPTGTPSPTVTRPLTPTLSPTGTAPRPSPTATPQGTEALATAEGAIAPVPALSPTPLLPASRPANLSGYAFFAALVAVLVVAGLVVRRQRK
jgi:hypothetical protein